MKKIFINKIFYQVKKVITIVIVLVSTGIHLLLSTASLVIGVYFFGQNDQCPIEPRTSFWLIVLGSAHTILLIAMAVIIVIATILNLNVIDL